MLQLNIDGKLLGSEGYKKLGFVDVKHGVAGS
jgi:hypothetical protein